MRLPNADEAYVDPVKVRDCLLSLSHPVGRFKATFFGRLGYAQENWRELEKGLREIARSGDVADEDVPRFMTVFPGGVR